ncbi:unnamed protein product [Prorocentrum cordatum]|uniref:Nitric-oxide synthase (NADPH) n=1 Tax=Prorocentrum cordatum TaxID=2364126 RepID=A0ABN9TAS5_9DINO|nr:unnamed protein product [Polarella glacialis]
MSHYALMGIRPKHWALLKEAFMFAIRTHNPYLYKDHDGVDLEMGEDGAISRFFHIHVMQKAHDVFQKFVDTLQSPDAVVVQRQAAALQSMRGFGDDFYQRLLTNYPELGDDFPHADMDHLTLHLQRTLQVIGKAESFGAGVRESMMSDAFLKLAQALQEAMIPSETFPKVGGVLLETLSDRFEMSKGVLDMWAFLFTYCATVVSVRMAVGKRLYAEAEEFFSVLAKEEEWTPAMFDFRMSQVRSEIAISGTYRHTTHELQAGARQAWRNSAKCPGRIAWDTLVIRDCRHVTCAKQIFDECEEHLKVAAGGGIVQSTMTIFAPKKPHEQWGIRFWNHQFCRYAGYAQEDGSVLGDPANVKFTEMVMKTFGWKPPTKRTKFDPLPQIVQLPGQDPQMCELPRKLFCEIPITHPEHPKLAKLGLKWTSLPAINNFTMRIGGVDYPCCPFNGWFVDLEIARNLVERYGVGPEVAKICGFDTSSNSSGWRAMVLQKMSAAVTHSFQKSRFSIVDHYTCSQQFLTHVDREKQCGREVPAQWSWIGGFLGVHCPAWHYEMRDFYLRPQFHYHCDRWVVEDASGPEGSKPTKSHESLQDRPLQDDPRKVLIVYASTTGTAEQFARNTAKELGLAYGPWVMELNSLSEKMVQRFTHIVCFIATFNDGAAPQNGAAFPDVLPFPLVSKKTGQPIRCAVMALGSTMYPGFCAFGKKVSKTLEAAGAACFVPTALADECKDQAADFQKFLRALRFELEPRQALAGTVESCLAVRLGEPRVGTAEASEPGEVRAHKRAEVVESTPLLANTSEERSTRRIRIDISRCDGMSYRTGGHLSVLPRNPHDEIVRLALELGIKEERLHARLDATIVEGEDQYPAELGFQPTTLYDALQWHLNITVRPASLPRILGMVRDAGGMTAEEHQELMQQDSEMVAEQFWWLSSLLHAFPRAKGKITLGALFGALPLQFPRLYSIASSNVVSPSVVELCVGLVCVGSGRGLASGYLHSLQVGSPVWVSALASSFDLPESPEAPMIMVGAGTGVAPFAGFVRERIHHAQKGAAGQCGKAQLFAGHRCSAETLHAGLFKEALDASALTTYDVSLSREPGVEKRLVTDGLRQSAQEVWELIQRPDCHYYVCGDRRMADDAHQALVLAIARGGNMSRARAVAFMDGMRASGRYHLDVWGVVKQGGKRRSLQNWSKPWLKIMQDTFEDDELWAPQLVARA